MFNLKFNLVSQDDNSNITLFLDGEMYVASDQHPNWNAILTGALANDPDVAELFDVSKTVSKRFDRLSDRTTVANGTLYFDGDEMDSSLADQVVRFLDEGVQDWKPLVNFLEKVSQNPQQHSREQLYEWLKRHAFTITDEGDIVGYKGVLNAEGGYTSSSTGTAIVNGVVHTGRIPQKVGDIVEMPRSEVAFDPSEGCSAGLHVANFAFARGFIRHDGTVLTVAVNPRDVVSVPTDSNFDKVRVCRYVVTGVAEVEITTPVYASINVEDEEDDELYCDYCDDYGHEENDCYQAEEDDLDFDDVDQPTAPTGSASPTYAKVSPYVDGSYTFPPSGWNVAYGDDE